MACRPKVLMLDERSPGLTQSWFTGCCPRALEEDGMAVPLAEQFAALALGVADYAVVLAGG